MDWFFSENIGDVGSLHLITGEDAVHITKSLRMAVGEVLTLCDNNKNEHLCKIERINNDGVLVRVAAKEECQHEPNIEVTLYFAMTKGDKPENVIQKSVELGVHRIVPVVTERCISRPDKKSADKKQQRYQKIAVQAAMQSRRGIIPQVANIMELSAAVKEFSQADKTIVFYEGGGKTLKSILNGSEKKIAIFIGPEGGLAEDEVGLMQENGAVTATLGKRILRAETAPIAALAAIMFHTGNLD